MIFVATAISKKDKIMSEFERIISDSMLAFEAYNNVPHEEGLELEDISWDPIMGDEEEYIDFEEDADWDVYGEEEFA